MHANARALGLCMLILFCPALQAEEDKVPPCGQPMVLPDKPNLDDYPDYSEFLLKIMKYKQAKREQAAHRQRCPQDYRPKPPHSNDPTVVEGPETLESAMKRAKRIARIDYQKHQTWFNHTTSHSFGLPAMATSSLESESIRTLLSNAGADKPVVFPLTLLSMQNPSLDGADAQALHNLTQYGLLPSKEQQADLAAFLATNPQALYTMLTTGRLTLILGPDNQLLTVNGVIEVENCLSSCVN
ncbi:MAG: hypothetical protein R3292_10860 [Alcanivorax sp.]|nr:hypothetical protein [Alcanivorax sp.]